MSKKFIDISITLENDILSDPPIMRPHIEYINHHQSVDDLRAFFFRG